MLPDKKNSRRKQLLGHLRDIVLVTIIGTFFAVNFTWSQLTLRIFLFDLLYSFMIGTSLWKGNELVGWLHEKYFPLHDKPGKLLTLSIIRVTIFSILNIFFINWIWVAFILKKNFWPWLLGMGGYWTFLIEIMITFIIALTLLMREYFKAWRESVRNEEKLKREALSMQYEALKNQVNPHFLFNSLNVLTSLVESDTKGSVKFIKQLSEVYRYVLEQKDKELVPVETEMKFVESYFYLQKIRYNENLFFIKDPEIINIPENLRIIPLSVQLLVENAIKHNVISKEQPLTIEITLENNEYLVIKNNLQKRSTVNGSGNIGLHNIRTRYEYLSDKKFDVIEYSGSFVVKIPLIKV